ncbi:hypothetical protein [Novosphingobium mangrovi (ex Huang et al. 2023)]|uniref:DUF4440 domain-containing protein n=1 Tax=Novosphingobium mangrovi (ex Huang et al. 2023) TaxID=2976432 RepID=A0ABT2I0P1_9SPHN|nr:hypothetical protein [Novosphingobium mangrovi (ex Huang et al. 2023)]MCT2398369.1 hypothetical protein [Novosphingobium mangrovi (ex Huang et al. 2023)]
MKRLGAVLLMAAAAASLAAPADAERRGRRPGVGTANPSALIAAEIAFAREAKEKGQWTAFRDYADDEAVMFAPGPVMAREWLRGRKDPPVSVEWEPYQVWMSCDGTLGVTKGAWQRPDGTFGYFTTIWRQQKKGDYRWVLDQGDALSEPLEQPDMLSASVADCPARGAGPRPEKPEANRERRREAGMDGGGRSDDDTLNWTYHVEANNARTLSVSLRKGGEMTEVLSLSVAGQAE